MKTKLKKRTLTLLFFILIVVCTIGVLYFYSRTQSEVYTFYQLPMTDPDGGCCYAIEQPNGKLIMIDSGYQSDAASIRSFIEEHGGVVEAWFVTHPHFDHAGGVIQILKEEAQAVLDSKQSNLSIKKVYYAPFTQDFFETEAQGKDLEVLNTAVLLSEFEECLSYEEWKTDEQKIKYYPVGLGEEIRFGEREKIIITCMNSFNEAVYDVNANSLVLHVEIDGVSFLVTGDITDQSVTNMKEYWQDSDLWNVDIIQIPHHGYLAGISSDELYRLTTPSLAFLDCSTNEYNTDAVGIRQHLKWLEELEIPMLKRFEGINQVQIKNSGRYEIYRPY